jgi:transcriptional regulator with XRE-family HTH domain
MSAELEITKELIAQILEASGKTPGAFSKDIGVTTKALRMYLDGLYRPRKAYTVAKLKELADIYEVKPSIPTEATASVTNHNAEFSPEILKAFQERSGLSSIEIAGLVGVSTDTWYKWLKGKHGPNRAKNIKALREIFTEDRPKRKPGRPSNLTDEALVKGGKHQLSVATAHDIANEFHALYQPRLDEAAVDYAMTLVCKKYNLDRSTLKRAFASLLLLLKDRLTPQELYEQFSGHTS